jgi:hypothetical protein
MNNKTTKIEEKEKKYPPLNGAAIEQTESCSSIARKIERYLNSCGMCLEVEAAEKLAAFDKTTLGDVIWTLGTEPNTKLEIIKYFRKQLKIEVYVM